MAAYTDVWTSILLIQLVNFDNQAILKLKNKLKWKPLVFHMQIQLNIIIITGSVQKYPAAGSPKGHKDDNVDVEEGNFARIILHNHRRKALAKNCSKQWSESQDRSWYHSLVFSKPDLTCL